MRSSGQEALEIGARQQEAAQAEARLAQRRRPGVKQAWGESGPLRMNRPAAASQFDRSSETTGGRRWTPPSCWLRGAWCRRRRCWRKALGAHASRVAGGSRAGCKARAAEWLQPGACTRRERRAGPKRGPMVVAQRRTVAFGLRDKHQQKQGSVQIAAQNRNLFDNSRGWFQSSSI